MGKPEHKRPSMFCLNLQVLAISFFPITLCYVAAFYNYTMPQAHAPAILIYLLFLQLHVFSHATQCPSILIFMKYSLLSNSKQPFSLGVSGKKFKSYE
jgi:hypothetical protein